MSDNGSGDAITDQIIAGLDAIGQADTAPEASAPANLPPDDAAPEGAEAAPAAPASDPAQSDEPLKVTASSRLIDPDTGEEVTWSKVKAERMMQADASKKWAEAASLKREAEALRAQVELEAAAAKLRAEQAALPALPDDDPFAQHQKMLANQLRVQQEAIAAMQAQAKAATDAANLAASQASLAAEEKRMADEYKFTPREIAMAESEYWRRRQEPGITLQSVAKELHAYLEERETGAVRKFKDTHRTGAPAAADAVPSTGTATAPLIPGTPGFADKVAAMFESVL